MIFVTGGTGLLGSHLLVELSKEHDSISALYRSPGRLDLTKRIFVHYLGETRGAINFDKIQWIQGDILDIELLMDIVPENGDIYHCAGLVSFHPSDFHPLMKINREGTFNMVNVCLEKKVRKFCYVSSTAAIGSTDDFSLIDEKIQWKKTPTTSAYSVSKYSAEKEVWRGIEEGLNAVMVNPCIILGAGNWDESSLAIFKTVSKGIAFYPSGSNAQVDARDVAEIMIRLMKSPIHSERYLCIGSNQSIKVLMENIAEQLQVRSPSRKAPKWLANVGRVVISFLFLFRRGKSPITKETVGSLYGNRSYSNEKICTELNFSFRTIDDTIENAIKGRIRI